MLAEQLLILSVFSMLFVWAIKLVWIGLLKQAKPSDPVMKSLIFAVSFVFAYVWTPVALPALPVFAGDLFGFGYALVQFVAALLAVSVIVMKAAQVIYDILWQKILDEFGKALSAIFKRS